MKVRCHPRAPRPTWIPGVILLGILLAGSTVGLAGPLTKIGVCPTVGPIRWSSPTLADLDGNPRTLEILVGDELGNVYAFRSDLSLMWSYSIRNFPQPENWSVNTPVQSSVAVGDIDADGCPEVVVTLGDRDDRNKPGRLFVIHLDKHGMNPQPGFYYVPFDRVEGANGVPDAMFSSPVLGDLNHDGRLEIIAGGFDYCLYAFDWSGNLIWNLNYDQENPVEHWYYGGDTIWGSPIVCDYDGDDWTDILFGLSNGGDRFAYQQIAHAARDGGALVALNWDGTVKFGSFMWEHYSPENAILHSDDHYCRVNPSVGIDGSPSMADVDNDGKLELLVGTGQYYGPPILNDRHQRIWCYNVEDDTAITAPTIDGVAKNPLWAVDVANEVYISPACGNLDGDPDLEVVVRSIDETNAKVYAIKGSTGTILPGFPQPLTPGNGRQLGSCIADIDGDGVNEILIPSYRDLFVFGNDGSLKDKLGWDVAPADWDNNHVPSEFFCCPAVGDIDDDGKVEVVISSEAGLYVYRGGNAGPIPWGQFRQNAWKNGYLPILHAVALGAQVPPAVRPGGSFPVTVTFQNQGSLTWTESGVHVVRTAGWWGPASINLPQGSHPATGEKLNLTFNVLAPNQPGTYALGWRMEQIGGPVFGGEVTVQFWVAPAAASRWEMYR